MGRLIRSVAAVLLVCVLCAPLAACMDLVNAVADAAYDSDSTGQGTAAPVQQVQYDGVKYTILVYMNGSNLESDGGMATQDLEEMLSASYPYENINVVVQTGGTAQWQNNVVPNDRLARYLITGQGMESIGEEPSASMGDPATLADFIDFGVQGYPAEKYGLVLWNHGGGSVGGYGVDELYNHDGLTLAELGEAFEASAMKEQQFEFLGFDACLMANIETAYVAQPYAKYLIASEEVEPGYGWDYTAWLNGVGADAGMDGAGVGTIAVKGFIDFYNHHGLMDEPTTLSVTDLSKVDGVVKALEDLVAAADLGSYPFQQIAGPRSEAKEFGMPSQYGGDLDMIDMMDVAGHFAELCPQQGQALEAAVKDAVVYSGMGPASDIAGGLSMYFPYHDRQNAPNRVEVYQTIGFSPKYTNYITAFTNELTGTQLPAVDVSNTETVQDDTSYTITLTGEQMSNTQAIYFTAWMYVEGDYYAQIYQDSDVDIQDDGTITTEFDGMVATVNGEMVCLYEMESTEDHYYGTIPAWLNGTSVNLLLKIDGDNPDGKVVGAYQTLEETNGMAPKNLIAFKDGDEITFAFCGEEFVDVDAPPQDEDSVAQWYQGATVTVEGDLAFTFGDVDPGEYMYGFTLVDYYGNESYTDFIVVTFE